MNACEHCDQILSPKEVPFELDGRTYCPQCFVWYIGHAEKHADGSDRFYAPAMIAGECAACEKISVLMSEGPCPQCGSTRLKALPAKSFKADAPIA